MKRVLFLLALMALLLLVSVALAQEGYDLAWFSVNGGSGTSEGGSYLLSGSAGQPEAGRLSGGPYTLVGGFWIENIARPGRNPRRDAALRLVKPIPAWQK